MHYPCLALMAKKLFSVVIEIMAVRYDTNIFIADWVE